MSHLRRESPCVQCAAPTRAAGWVCLECRASTAQRPEVECWHCERVTTAKSGICRSCCRIPVSARPSKGDALDGGGWVRKGLVYRWIEAA